MIRKAEVYDLEKIVELEEKIFGHTLGYAFLKQELLDNEFSRIYVYTDRFQIKGYISYRVVDKNADILNFLVDDRYQSSGIGSELFTYVLLEMKLEGVTSLILEVRESNQKAINFYTKYGAKQIHKLSNYYLTEDALIMTLEVK